MSRAVVVEDNPWVPVDVADDLAGRCYEIVTARHEVEALLRIGEVRPDVIVLDLLLPQLDGGN